MIKTGLEVLRDDDFRLLRGRRVGLMTNPSAVDTQLRSTYRIFAQSPDINLAALFAPEHGFFGVAAEGETIASTRDPLTGVPVFSLYGDTYGPSAEMLKDVDVLVCDIQDIGVRYYTFTWTVSYILEAAGQHGVQVVILDRPNPLGGQIISGPLLEPHLSSLVGRFPIPVQHGMTLGELAHMINTLWNPTPAELTIIPCEGWQRGMGWEETKLSWVPPSPNMPYLHTLWQYPGACLIEGTQLSEGRGTPLPFEIVGAPWIDAVALAEQLNSDEWGERLGARFRPHIFHPTDSKWRGEYCHGIQVYRMNEIRWRPLEVWLGIILTIRCLYPEQFAWLPSQDGMQHFDRLIGTEWVRREIEAAAELGTPVNEVLARFAVEWADDCHAFGLQRQPYLLYLDESRLC